MDNNEEEVVAVRTLGSLADEMHDLKEEKKALDTRVNKIKESMAALEQELIVLLDAQDSTMSAGRKAQVVLTEVEVPKVDEWDLFYAHIMENEAFHLLQRRPATTACRETLEAGEEIPGMSVFLKRAISLRQK